MKILSIVILSLMFAILVFLALYLIVVRIVYKKVLGRKDLKKRLDEKSGLINLYKIDICFWDKFKFEELTLISEDGLKLKAHYYKRAESAKIAIVVHGYGSDYREMSNYCKMFIDMGYSVLALENRAHGKSEGNMIGMGYFDRLDILSWINFLTEREENCKIVLFGLSMGGTAVCNTLGETLPKNVVCAISDCAFDNLYNQFDFVFNKERNKFKSKLLKIFYNYMCRAYDFDFKRADASDSVKKSRVPVMFIHGKEDDYVPIGDVYKLSSNLNEFKKDLYIVENAGHAMSYVVNPRRYEMRVREFLKKWGM